MGGKAKWGGLSRNGEGVGGLIYYIEVFLEIPHDAAQEKNLDVFIFPLLTNVLQSNCSNKIRDHWHCNSFKNVDSYNSCITYSCK